MKSERKTKLKLNFSTTISLEDIGTEKEKGGKLEIGFDRKKEVLDVFPL